MNEVSESDIDAAVAQAFGREVDPSSGNVDLFKSAGFCQEDAEVGARLMRSGRYAGFLDVATSMGMFDGDFGRRNPYVTPGRIREAAGGREDPARSRVVEKLIEAASSGNAELAKSIAQDLKVRGA